ncbi:MAG: NUDIX hydrolase [Akkermansia sp.]|nr:NUDIX hydrolase [Akkermansia sp.]
MKEVVYTGKFLNMAKEGRWEFCERVNDTRAAMIFACTPDNKVLLVEEFRPPVGARCLCFPAGLVGDVAPESAAAAATRELEEETGYTAASMQLLFAGPSSPGLTSEMLSFFLATGLSRVSQGGGVDGENITVHEVPMDQIDSWLEQKRAHGVLVDPRIYTGLYFLRQL